MSDDSAYAFGYNMGLLQKAVSESNSRMIQGFRDATAGLKKMKPVAEKAALELELMNRERASINKYRRAVENERRKGALYVDTYAKKIREQLGIKLS